jgi:hypothetical protein
VRVALEIEHGIHDVFEHARPGQRALLGHVADQDDRDAGLFGQAGELRCAFAHLRDRPGRRTELLRPQGLDRVDHRHLRLRRLQRGEDLFQIDLGQQLSLPVASDRRRARIAICWPDSSPLT